MKRKMMSGAGGYFQGEHVLQECGPELKRQTRSSAFVVGGRHALAAAYADVSGSLEREGISHTVHTFSGFCTAGRRFLIMPAWRRRREATVFWASAAER